MLFFCGGITYYCATIRSTIGINMKSSLLQHCFPSAQSATAWPCPCMPHAGSGRGSYENQVHNREQLSIMWSQIQPLNNPKHSQLKVIMPQPLAGTWGRMLSHIYMIDCMVYNIASLSLCKIMIIHIFVYWTCQIVYVHCSGLTLLSRQYIMPILVNK